MTNSADPDHLASSTDLDLHCLLKQGMSSSAREVLRSFNVTLAINLISKVLNNWALLVYTSVPFIYERRKMPVYTKT